MTEHAASPEFAGLWHALSTAVMGAHHRSIVEFHSGADLPQNSSPEWFQAMARAVEFMAFRSISRRIEHRPITEVDVDDVVDELYPHLLALGAAPEDEIRDAVRLAIGRPPSQTFDRSDANSIRRVVGYWTAITGVRIADATELEAMKPEVVRWLSTHDLLPLPPAGD